MSAESLVGFVIVPSKKPNFFPTLKVVPLSKSDLFLMEIATDFCKISDGKFKFEEKL